MTGNWLTDPRPCPQCGTQLVWHEFDPPWEGWWDCPQEGTKWRTSADGTMLPADQVKPVSPYARDNRRP